MINHRLLNTGVEDATVECLAEELNVLGTNEAYSSNIATYKMNGDATDVSENYDGTASNITYTTGKFGNAAVFNGSSSSIQTGIQQGSNPFTWSVWLKPNDITTSQYAIAVYNGANYHQFYIRLNGSNYNINCYNGTLYSFSTSAVLNEWAHLVLTYDGTGMIGYFNGVALGARKNFTALSLGTQQTLLGGVQNAGNTAQQLFYNGSIDQVRIFDKAISAEEVELLYNETTASTTDTNPLGESSAVALYPLSYDASEISGEFDGTATNVDFGVGGAIGGYAARFNGSSSKIFLTSTGTSVTDYDSDFSVSMWVYMKNLPHATSQDHLWTGGGTRIIPMSIKTDGKVLIDFFSGSSNSLTSTTALTLNGWTHLLMTRSKTNGVKFYLDGSESGTSTYTGNASSLSQRDTIGSYWDGTRMSFDGSIDQVRIFNKALNQTEVDTLFAETACTHVSTTDIVDYPTDTTPVAYYKMDNSAEDETGSYDGTDTNVEYRFGRFGQAAVFNGSSSYISIPATNTTPIDFSSESHTFSAWVNVDNISGDKVIISKWHNTTASLRSTIFYVSGGNIKILEGGSADNTHTSTGTISANTWTHIVYTRAATESKIYINGSSDSTHSRSATIRQGGTEDIFIGFQRGGYKYYDGSIDQVRIYSTALTSSQVADLYNEKPEVDTSNFKTVLYEGNGSGQYISNVGYNLDVDNGGDGGLVWLKNRTTINSHAIFDSVRGATKRLSSNSTGAEVIATTNLTSFDANGFFLGNAQGVNGSGDDYVSWVFKGGGEAVQNTQGDITSDVSANTEAGFSIVKWTGTEANATIGHGIDTPELIIIKNASAAKNWTVYSSSVGATKYGKLNLTDDFQTASTAFNNTDPTSSVFSVGSASVANGNGNTMIAYCFHSVAGYSKIGSYTGTGAAGHAIVTGFEPSFVMIKRASATGAWYLYDNKRTTGVYSDQLDANTSNAEYNGTYVDLDSNGFSLNTAASNLNENGSTFIYMAFK